MVATFMMSSKLASLGLLKIKLFWNKDYDVIIFVHDLTNKILSRDSNYIVDAVMWSKFGNFIVSMSKVIMTVVQVHYFGTAARYGLEILHKCGKKFETKSQKVFVLLTANFYICRS